MVIFHDHAGLRKEKNRFQWFSSGLSDRPTTGLHIQSTKVIQNTKSFIEKVRKWIRLKTKSAKQLQQNKLSMCSELPTVAVSPTV